MRYASVDDSLHHLLARQQYVESLAESSDRILDSDMVYLIPILLICGPYKDLLDALRSFDSMSQHHDHLTSAACSWGSFCADSWGYFLTVFYIVLSDYERD